MPVDSTHILIVAEVGSSDIQATSRELFGVGRELATQSGGGLAALLLGPAAGDGVAIAGALGADVVYAPDAPELHEFTVDGYSLAVIAAIDASGARLVLLPGTTSGRDVAPFVAARRDAPYLVDCTRLRVDENAVVGTRPVFQGKFLTEVTASADLVIATIHAGSFAEPEVDSSRTAERRDLPIEFPAGSIRVTVKDLVTAPSGPTNLDAADVVVVGGRGLGEAGNFKLVEELAELLGGAVGATRAVTDLGWRPHYEQVGQTGKAISPQLYVGVAVSGAVQHTVGMRASDTIVAINRDADAPIFKLADFGIVGDVFEVVPAIIERLKANAG